MIQRNIGEIINSNFSDHERCYKNYFRVFYLHANICFSDLTQVVRVRIYSEDLQKNEFQDAVNAKFVSHPANLNFIAMIIIIFFHAKRNPTLVEVKKSVCLQHD